MLIVLFAIFLIMIIIGLIWIGYSGYADEEFFPNATIFLGGIFELIVVIAMIFNGYNISKLQVSDRKIAMYQEENNNIQTQITDIVDNYMKYESNTYDKSLKNIDLKNTDVVVLTQLYPNLKSDEMVKTQIEIYQKNNEAIKKLKEEKLDYEVSKWWLYFGKIKGE